MWIYEKGLEFPVNIKEPNAQMAQFIMSQYGGPVSYTHLAPHWAPPEFCEWEYYNRMWQGIMDWLTK